MRLSLLLVTAAACAEPLVTAPPVLPLRRVHLYENGVAYFERAGPHEANAPITLPIAAGRVDDVLKSLVVLQEQQSGSVRAVEFETRISQSRARALAGLPDGAKQALSYCALATSLKGSRVQIDDDVGRLIEVIGCEGEGALTLLLLRDHDGAILRFAERDVERLMPLDTRDDLDRAVAALSTRRADANAPLRLQTSASGKIAVGYVSEAPLWRVSYRIVTSKTGTRLQAWALLHNDTNEAWQDVTLALISGQPDTFLFPLAAPRYSHRQMRSPSEYLPSVPQLARRSPDDLWDEEEAGEGVGSGSAAGVAYGHASSGSSYGALGGSRTTSSDLLEIGALVPAATAAGDESGALFRFDLQEAVSLGARASKLVPLVDAPIEAHEITWFAENGTTTAALLLKNDTQHLLPSGPLAWYRDGSFSGEGALDRLDPKQRRVLQLGDDPAIKGERTTRKQNIDYRAFTWNAAHKRLVVHRVDVRDLDISVDNRSKHDRVMYCPLGQLVANAKVEGADQVDFEPESKEPIAVFTAAAGKETQRVLHIEQGVAEEWPIDRTTAFQLADLAQRPGVPAVMAAVLREAAALVTKDRDGYDKLAKLEDEVRALEADIIRLKEHLKVAGDDAAPLVQRLATADDKLAALKRQVGAAQEQVNKRLDDVKVVLGKLPSSG